jgi:hypothetical protein
MSRHAVGREAVDTGESGKTKAKDATNLINKGYVCEVHQACGETLEKNGAPEEGITNRKPVGIW